MMRQQARQQHETLKAAFAQMCSQPLGFAALTVCFAAIHTGHNLPEFRKLELSDRVAAIFRDIALRAQRKYLRGYRGKEYVFRDYIPEAKLDGYEIEYVDLQANTDLAQQIAALASIGEIDPFSEKDGAFIAALRFYVIALQLPNPDSPPLYCFRAYSRSRILGQSKTFGLFWQKGQYDTVERPVIMFDQDIDCIAWGTHLFIFKKDHFQNIFQYFEQLRRAAQATLEKIHASVPIANFDRLVADSHKQILILAKMRSIMSKSYWQRISLTDIQKVIDRRGLNIQIATVDGERQIVYDPADPWTFLKLLDDDYLTSLMTGLDYEVGDKRDLVG